MSRRWVSDASPIIVLSKIGQVHLLPALCDELVVPLAVAEEISAGTQDDPGRIWVHGEGSRYIQEHDLLSHPVVPWDLGRGETVVLSWAYEHPGYEAILDDRAARTCARSLNLPVRGTIGVILLAKKMGAIERAGPFLDRIIAAGLHVSSDVLKTARRLAGED